MKLVGISLFTALALAGGSAPARGDDVLDPPGGRVHAPDASPAPQDGRPGRGAIRARALRRVVVEQFDADGDGRLDPGERMRAVRVLRRLERQLARGDDRAQRRQMMRRFIDRHDRNGDGELGPREVPPGAAGRLRRLDRDRDGWLAPDELDRPPAR